MNVLGLDVSKDNVCAALLFTEDANTEPRKLYLSLPFSRLYANPAGIKSLLALSPDVAVLEPTGVNYTRIWATKLAEAGVQVMLVGHKQLRTFREALGLPDKDDQADSLALALYYLQKQNNPLAFVRQRDDVVAQMRDITLRLHHAARVQSPLINRIRQDLAWQYPEAAKRRLEGVLFWGWMAGERKSLRYDLELKNTCGLGLTDHTRRLAKLLWEVLEHEQILERELRSLLDDPRFLSYRKVFAQFGFGERIEALILSQIYPLENYLKDGSPEVLLSRSKKDPKRKTKKNISERKFLKALGVAPSREYSGDMKATKKAGSELVRTALWQWCFTRIEVKRNRPVNLPDTTWEIPNSSEILKGSLAEYFDRMHSHKPIKLARSKTCAKASLELFRLLVKEVITQ